MFLHDAIKIEYVRQGFLPNYPYHMTSDEEMLNAFLPYTDTYELDTSVTSFFSETYLNPFTDDTELQPVYVDLVRSIAYHIEQYKSQQVTELPSWVYSYMLGSVIGSQSAQIDIHDLGVLVDADNEYDEFTLRMAQKCYKISKEWIARTPGWNKVLYSEGGITIIDRPPTIFGELHVIKSSRLAQINSAS